MKIITKWGDDIKLAYGYIYRFKNKINGKSYIGQSVQPEKRIKQHIGLANNGSNTKFHRAIRKYGIENFEYEILYGDLFPIDNISDCLDRLEIYFINVFDSYNNGYNMTGGGGGYIHTTGGMLGKNHSKETKEKIREHTLLQMQDPEQRKRISESLKGRKQDPEVVKRRGESIRGKNKGKHRVYREDGTFYMSR